MNILVEHHEQIATITLNRPSKLNALDADLLAGIYETITEIGANHQTRCVIITGSGKAFVAGADIAAIQNMDSCLLYTSPSPRDRTRSRMPSSA